MKRTGRGRQQRKCAVATKDNGDIVGQHHAQQLDLLGSMYNEAPQAVWQSAATRALEVNALLMAAVVGEQRRVEQDRSFANRSHDAEEENDSDVEMDTEEEDEEEDADNDRPVVDESNDFDESKEDSDEEEEVDDKDDDAEEEDDSARRGRSRRPAASRKK